MGQKIKQTMTVQRRPTDDLTVDQGLSLIVTVSLSSGVSKTHRYDLADEPEALKAFIDRWFDQLQASLRRETSVLPLLFPTVLYNLDHVAAIEISAIARADLQQLVEHANERMGFLKDK